MISSRRLLHIPSGSRAIFDTNILVYWVTGHPRFGNHCTEAVKRVEKGEFQGVIAAIILNELLHHIMIAGTVEKGYAHSPLDAVRTMKQDPFGYPEDDGSMDGVLFPAGHGDKSVCYRLIAHISSYKPLFTK